MKEFLAQFAVFFIFALWERWLGKTKKLKSNSTLELLTNIIRGEEK
jgi:hypothetical protein